MAIHRSSVRRWVGVAAADATPIPGPIAQRERRTARAGEAIGRTDSRERTPDQSPRRQHEFVGEGSNGGVAEAARTGWRAARTNQSACQAARRKSPAPGCAGQTRFGANAG